MAVVNVKSTQIANRDATPSVKSNGVQSFDVRHARGVCTVTNGDSAASIYRFCSIPSNARVISVRLTAPDIGTTTAGDVGLYKDTLNGSAVVSVALFGSAISLNGGAITKSEVLFESGTTTIANSEKAIWEHLGLASDPGTNYDVCLTLTGAADAGGSVLLEVDYTK